MKTFKIISVLALTLLILIGSGIDNTVHAVRKLKVVNFSGKTIEYIYCKRSDVDDWGSDLLGSNSILKHGKSFTINLPDLRYFDLRVVTKNKNDWKYYGINTTAYSRVTIRGTNGIADYDKN